MPLVLAIKNHDSIVVATDSDGPSRNNQFGQLLSTASRAVLLTAGNIEAVRPVITEVVIPKITTTTSAAALAQIVQAAMTLEVVPRLNEIPGRVEFIIAGIDPVRHIEQPGLYYLDSAEDFRLTIVNGDAAAAGSTAAVTSLLEGHDFADASIDHLKVLAKECLASTKLRWPAALGNHITLGVITPSHTSFQEF